MRQPLLLFVLVAAVASAANPSLTNSPTATQRQYADSLRDPAEAVRAYQRLERLAAASEPETAVYALLQQGIWRQREQRLGEAVAIWQRLRRFHPQSPHAATALAMEAKAAPTPAQGERLREELLAKYPDSPETATVLCERGQTAFDRQDYATAVKWWEQLVTRFPRHAKVVPVSKSLEIARLAVTGKEEEADGLALVARADKLYDKAEFALAEKLYRQAVGRLGEKDEIAGRAALRLAQCQFAQGETRDAMQTLEEALRRLPAQGAKLLGQLVEQSGGNPLMDGIRQRATQMLLARFPQSYEAQMALFVNGAVAKARGQRAEWERQWKELLATYPETEFRGVVERELKGEAEQAVLAQEKAKRAEAEAAARQKKATEAAAAKQKAEQDAIAEARRKEQERQEFFTKETQRWEGEFRSPTATTTDQARSGYFLAHFYAAKNQFDAAQMTLQWVWQNAPGTHWAAECRLTSAQVYLRAGDWERAEQMFERAAQERPGSSARCRALFFLGNRQVLYHGNRQKAWEYYEQLVEEYPDSQWAEDVRQYWAQVVKLSEAELQRQVREFRQSHPRPGRSNNPR